MIRRKSAGVVVGIIVIAAMSWAALVKFVLTDSILVGSGLSLAGGVAIGAGVALLLRRWWFKGGGIKP